ncbi:glutathione S-transferase family protein [Maricurvus nonylphenolicus]|uniref:glutathione S-transferase family protein n=1 Tax=Maricurvus nonylphenolicus TaxID=1008307 RepID=UPI0036F3B4CC
MSSTNDKYQLYVVDQSYYSGKLHSYLRYRQLPLEVNEISFTEWWKTGLRNTGLMKVPFLQSPDGRWLQDSTPIILWLDQQFPDSGILPDDPYLRFFCYLLEDYADEWLWRPAMHYRWSYSADAAVNSIRFSQKLITHIPGPKWLTALMAKWRQRSEYVKHDGVNKSTLEHVESIYLNNLQWMETILAKQPYLLGDKPCLVDFGFMGPMFRHFSIDPTPAKIMRDKAPHVYQWVARMWALKMDDVADANWNVQPGQLPQDWLPFVKDICEAYLPYLLENARTCRDGKSSCSYTVQGTSYSKTRTYDYRVWCREQLHKRFNELTPEIADRVKATLKHYGGWDAFITDVDISSGMDADDMAPFRKSYQPSFGKKLVSYFFGTPWNTSKQ